MVLLLRSSLAYRDTTTHKCLIANWLSLSLPSVSCGHHVDVWVRELVVVICCEQVLPDCVWVGVFVTGTVVVADGNK